VSACVAALRRTGAEAVGGPQRGVGETPFGRAVARAAATRFGAGDAAFRLGGAGPVETVYLGAWRRDLFDRIGLFDEGLPRNQDYELAERIRRAGGTVWLDPAIRTETVTRGTPGALARQYFGYGTGRAGTLVRHPGSLRPRQAVPALFVATLAGLALAAPASRAARRGLGGLAGLYATAVWVAARRACNGASTRTATEVAAGGRFAPSVRLRGRDGPRAPWAAPATHRCVAAYAVMHGAWGLGFWVGLARELGRRVGRG
jgi:hypothetical protein